MLAEQRFKFLFSSHHTPIIHTKTDLLNPKGRFFSFFFVQIRFYGTKIVISSYNNVGNMKKKHGSGDSDYVNNVALLHRFPLLALLLHPLGVGSFLDVHDLLGNRSKRVCANAVSIRAEWRTYRRNHSLGGYIY